MNGEIDAFEYSSEYIDAFFDVSEEADRPFSDDELDVNLDLLMGIQDWRKGSLDDIEELKDRIWVLEEGSNQRLRLEYLLGQRAEPEYYYDDVVYRNGGFEVEYEWAMEEDVMYDMAPMAADAGYADFEEPMAGGGGYAANGDGGYSRR